VVGFGDFMIRRIDSIVKPDILIWARKSLGLLPEEAAKKIGVKTIIFQKWESGKAKPTINQLRKAANVYKRPLAVFFLEAPPKEKSKPRDFRKLPEEEVGQTSPGLSLAVRNVQRKRDLTIQLLELLDEKLETKIEYFKISDDPEKIALEVRKKIGVSIEKQFGWRTKYDALNSWIDVIEKQGILVFQMSGVEVSEARAFSIAAKELPAITVNGKDYPKPRIFSLFHEYAHLVLNKGGMCDLEDRGNDVRSRVERFCNHFSGAFLVPKSELLEEQIVKTQKRKEFEDHDLDDLARKYKVSSEVVLRRLLILGRTTNEFYRKKRAEFIKRTMKKTEGFMLPHKRAMRDNGNVFTNLVLRAYREEAITGSNVADYLGVRLKHLSRIEYEMLGR